MKNSQDILGIEDVSSGGVGNALSDIKAYSKVKYLRQCTLDAGIKRPSNRTETSGTGTCIYEKVIQTEWALQVHGGKDSLSGAVGTVEHQCRKNGNSTPKHTQKLILGILRSEKIKI